MTFAECKRSLEKRFPQYVAPRVTGPASFYIRQLRNDLIRTLQALESAESLCNQYIHTDKCRYENFKSSAESQRKHLRTLWINYCRSNQ